MIRRLIVALAGIPLALGLIVASSSPASAHNPDDVAFFYCSYYRPSSSWFVLHSVPIFLNTQTVIYRCEAWSLPGVRQYDVWVSVVDGSSARGPYKVCPDQCVTGL